MTDIFYLIGVVFLFVEMVMLFEPRMFLNLIKRFEKEKEKPTLEQNSKFISNVNIFTVVSAIYMLWIMIGVFFSSNSAFFITLLMIGVVGYLLGKNKSDKTRVIFSITSSAISAYVLVELIYGHFG